MGETVTTDERPADNIEMTFKEVGDTPGNKYHVLVDKENPFDYRVGFFSDEANQDFSNFVMPWKDYQLYGSLKLSGDRDKLQLTEISVDWNDCRRAFLRHFDFEKINVGRVSNPSIVKKSPYFSEYPILLWHSGLNSTRALCHFAVIRPRHTCCPYNEDGFLRNDKGGISETN